MFEPAVIVAESLRSTFEPVAVGTVYRCEDIIAAEPFLADMTLLLWAAFRAIMPTPPAELPSPF